MTQNTNWLESIGPLRQWGRRHHRLRGVVCWRDEGVINNLVMLHNAGKTSPRHYKVYVHRVRRNRFAIDQMLMWNRSRGNVSCTCHDIAKYIHKWDSPRPDSLVVLLLPEPSIQSGLKRLRHRMWASPRSSSSNVKKSVAEIKDMGISILGVSTKRPISVVTASRLVSFFFSTPSPQTISCIYFSESKCSLTRCTTLPRCNSTE